MATILGILHGPRDATMRFLLITSLKRNLVPDVVIRRLLRMFIASRIRYSYQPSSELQLSQLLQFIHCDLISLKEMPITLNSDHEPQSDDYELPTSFFKMVLGKYLKFRSVGLILTTSNLDDAEEAMLALYCERAQIKDGQSILDIGCGRGCLCLCVVNKYNNCRVTGLTNSTLQKAYVDEQCRSGPRDATMRFLLTSLKRNLVPDVVIRRLLRMFIASRIRYSYQPSPELQLSQLLQFIHSLKEMPVTLNSDHEPQSDAYELPTSFFKMVLGKYLKFSCCYFVDKTSNLDDAEEAMLALYCERAQIKDGQSILDIGCGWGCLCLYIVNKYNNCRVTGLTNSTLQKAYVDEQCRDLQLQNVDVIAADVSTFEMEASYDRIISIGTFEHMKNYKDLLKKISGWMKQDGLLFVDHMCHKTFAYHKESVIEDEWISKYNWLATDFFSGGGVMPSANLLLYFQDDVLIVDHWLVNAKHFVQTSEEWLKRMDQNICSIRPMMESTYGKDSSVKWIVYWRSFFIHIAELFGFNNGQEWMVSHLLFQKRNQYQVPNN